MIGLWKRSFLLQCFQHAWDSSPQLGSQQTSPLVSWEVRGFPKPPDPRKMPKNGHRCHQHLLNSSWSHTCISSGPQRACWCFFHEKYFSLLQWFGLTYEYLIKVQIVLSWLMPLTTEPHEIKSRICLLLHKRKSNEWKKIWNLANLI